MMDYCTRESTLNTCEGEVRTSSIKMDIQETYKILTEMDAVLNELGMIIKGPFNADKKQKDVNCLCEEARLVTALAYDCLNKLLEIKNSIV